MRPKRQYGDYLQDMVEHIDKAMQFVLNVSFDDFCDNEEKVLAVVKTLEIIGEAARHLPKSLRDQDKSVPWKQVIGMRDRMTHEYFSVDLEVVWKTVHEDLPFQVHVTFTNGTERTIDLVPFLRGPMFQPIRDDPRVFASVFVDPEGHTLAWPNGADIAPETLYYEGPAPWAGKTKSRPSRGSSASQKAKRKA